MQNYQDFLDQHVHSQTKSIQGYRITPNLKVWLKKASTRHPWWIYLPLQWISKVLKLHALTPVRNFGGSAAIECEAQRLTELAQQNISVPKVLATSKAGLLIQDIASDDKKLMQLDKALTKEKDFEIRKALFLKTIQEIKKIHAKGQYLSEAFARNILVDHQHNISFIDFETDPKKFMDLHTCHTRDWLCLIFSSALRFKDNERTEIENMLKYELKDEPQILADLSIIGIRFTWLNKIGIERAGNDGKRMKIFLIFLTNLQAV